MITAWTNVPRKQGGLGSINIPLGKCQTMVEVGKRASN